MGLWLCHVKIQNRKVLFKIKDSYKINTAIAQNGLINVLPITRNIGENPKLHLSQATIQELVQITLALQIIA
jgi:hypothetical protein